MLSHLRTCCHGLTLGTRYSRVNSTWTRREPKNPKQGEIVFGLSSCAAAVEAGRRSIFKVYVQDESHRGGTNDDRSRRTAIADKALELGLPLKTVDKGTLNGLCLNRPHQGVALDCSPLEYTSIRGPDDLLNVNDKALVMVLDQVTDPMNLGALLRSAHCFGVSVVVSAKNCCSLTPTVSKASAGAMEWMRVYSVAGSMVRFLTRCQENGWTVAAATANNGQSVHDFVVSGPTVLVMGSEGFGLRPLVEAQCNAHITIQTAVSTKVDSLNVSVAAGILLHHLATTRQSSEIKHI